jgi:acyl-homoserine lactone acylase PvdQ
MNSPHHRSCLGLAVLLLGTFFVAAAPGAADGKIGLRRDTWGVPHVLSDTDNGAMYWLAYDVD